MKRRNSAISSRISVGGRAHFSALNEKMVRKPIPRSPAARTVRRSASTPRRCPSARGSPRAAAQRPLPSMMMATCRGAPKRAVREVGALAWGMSFGPIPCSLDGQDFLFFHRERVIDFGNGLIGRLLDLIGVALVVVLADLVVLLELLEDVEAVPAHVAYRHAGGFGVSMGHFDQLLATLLVELGDAKAQHLALGRRIEPAIAIAASRISRSGAAATVALTRQIASRRSADERRASLSRQHGRDRARLADGEDDDR